MAEVTVGIREFKAHLSEYLRRVKAGETIVLTERGKPVGEVSAPKLTTLERVRMLAESGAVAWSGELPDPDLEPAGEVAPGRSVADLLIADRG